ncbi:tetratricopeptide repeat protein [Flavobacterium sediminilitoris]|uniref:Tetratricopeptide repeat protein n=1 Tax=Flavobacterium sediminilitoris TaxID=2024526 RepID=A0ABY4HIR3_9FLAO|nr:MULTISPECIES: tetratricopeptide repeat protein [Flavobacterium]UOX32712.1 tetratricopeptide repeat protein [Flavobacterium sediminilitoris]
MFLNHSNINFKTIITFSFLLIVQLLYSQNNKIDSLKIELNNYKFNDTIRVNLLCDLAHVTLQTDIKLIKRYLEEAESISNTLKYDKGKARVFYLKGILENINSNYDSSLQFFNKALKYYESVDDKKGIADVYTAFGITNYDLSQYKQALENYKKATIIYKELDNKRAIATSLINSGNVYSELGSYNEAISNYKEALHLSKIINDEDGISYVQSNLGTVYKSQGNYFLAIDNFNKSLYYDEKTKDTLGIAHKLNDIGEVYSFLNKQNKALVYHKKSLDYSIKLGYKRLIAVNNINIGNIYLQKNEYEKAIQYFEKALRASEEINDLKQASIAYINIGKIHSIQNKPIIARKNYTIAKKISQEINNKRVLCTSILGIAQTYLYENENKEALLFAHEGKKMAKELDLLENQKEASKLLSEIYKNIGDYKNALLNQEQFKVLSDSILNKDNIEKITQLEYEYKYKKELDDAAEREIKLTKTVASTSKDLEKSQRNLLLGIITFLIVAMVLSSIIFFLKLRNSKAKTQNIITEQKLLRTQMTPHFIFNSLSVLQGMILNKEESKSVSYLSKFSKLLRITLENSRDKTVLLSQELEAVKNYLALQHIENDKITFQLNVDNTIETNKIKVPPMLIQPFVENAIEHAFNKQKENCIIEIKLTLVDSKLICVILDNGIGVDSSERNFNQNKKSLATKITKERLGYLSKDFKMEASIAIEDRSKYDAQGTQVTIEMPYTKTV